MKPPKWTLVFGLALLCAPSEAAPSRDDSHRRKEGHDVVSLRLPPARPARRAYYPATPLFFEHLPPGLAQKRELPPGLRGRVDGIDARGSSWHTPVETVAPTDDVFNGSMTAPEPSALTIFAGGLLIVRAVGRRRRI